MKRFLPLILIVAFMFSVSCNHKVVRDVVKISQDCILMSAPIPSDTVPIPIDVVKSGSILTYLGNAGDYYKVTDGKLSGYVWKKLLVPTTVKDSFVVVDGGATVNSSFKGHSSIGTFKGGDSVTLIEIAPTWYKVTTDMGKTGFVYCGYSKLIQQTNIIKK